MLSQLSAPFQNQWLYCLSGPSLRRALARLQWLRQWDQREEEDLKHEKAHDVNSKSKSDWIPQPFCVWHWIFYTLTPVPHFSHLNCGKWHLWIHMPNIIMLTWCHAILSQRHWWQMWFIILKWIRLTFNFGFKTRKRKSGFLATCQFPLLSKRIFIVSGFLSEIFSQFFERCQ